MALYVQMMLLDAAKTTSVPSSHFVVFYCETRVAGQLNQASNREHRSCIQNSSLATIIKKNLPPNITGWWFFPTHLKHMLVKFGNLPQFSGWKFQKYLSCHQLDKECIKQQKTANHVIQEKLDEKNANS